MVYELYKRSFSIAAGPRLLCLVGLVLGTSACDRSDDESERARACGSFCDALEKCDDGTDLLDCKKHCGADDVRSDAYFRARASCAQGSCNLWVDEVDSQGDDECVGEGCYLIGCIDRELSRVKLSPEQERDCVALGNSVSNCDSALDNRVIESQCKQITPALSASYREESQICVESKCPEIQSCIDDLAKDHGTELKVYSETINR